MTVEAEGPDDAPLERADEEVRQEVRAGLLGQRLLHLVAREHVVARVAAQPRHPGAREHRVELAPCAAVRAGPAPACESGPRETCR